MLFRSWDLGSFAPVQAGCVIGHPRYKYIHQWCSQIAWLHLAVRCLRERCVTEAAFLFGELVGVGLPVVAVSWREARSLGHVAGW